MQLIITDSRLSRSYVLQTSPGGLALTLAGFFIAVTLVSPVIYHWFLRHMRQEEKAKAESPKAASRIA